MCVKEDTLLKQFGKILTKLLGKFLARVLYRILKITLTELLWCILTLCAIIFVWNWNRSDNNEEIEEYHIHPNPIILWWTSGFPGTSETRVCPRNIKCDVISNRNNSEHLRVEAFLFYASSINFENLPLPRRPGKIIWGLYHEESPRNVEELMHYEALSIFNFSSTFSRYSDVPYPLQYLESVDDITSTKYFVPTAEKNKLLNELSPILYLQTDCETTTERDFYARELMQYINIDSYGSCLQNIELPREFAVDYLNKLNDDAFLKFVGRYKFVLAIENGVCEDYVTEKFWRAIKVGSVPIYFGSPTIRDWLPNEKSAILLDDYPTPKVMAEYIEKLMNDDYLYETHLTHKTRNVITNTRLLKELEIRPYENDPLQTAVKFECYVCEAIYKRRLGDIKEHVVNKSHYNCPEPISALSLNVNPENDWVFSYKVAKEKAQVVYKKVMG
ncbi:alpha-(1,3)-fucosyltransferase 10 [Aricia agestis]|uniref:alpha-(1,3)-fucosyltransferase 10 n=1 Tax=Aricia agestis TaxID=91739 RepID=UPI001C20510D|nr:alpha-(1,3)-fucosyltransferase 10 [Aricia agestis]